MSIVQKLSEGIVNRDMAREGQALLNKWSQTGLLEGLQTETAKHNMARLLENQAKELLRESNTMSGGSVEGFAAVAFPIVRRVFAGLIANDLVSVQPMSLPSGLIFFLDFTFGTELGDASIGNLPRFGNVPGKSIYGTDQVGSQITGGVDIVGATNKVNLSGPRDLVGYAYASPTGSKAVTTIGLIRDSYAITSSMSADQKKWLLYDPDILALMTSAGTTATHAACVIELSKSVLFRNNAGMPDADFDNLGAFSASAGGVTMAGKFVQFNAGQVRRLTRLVPAADTMDPAGAGASFVKAEAVRFVIVGRTGSTNDEVRGQNNGLSSGLQITTGESIIFPMKDNLTAGQSLGSVTGAAEWGLEDSTLIPEIDIKVDSVAITAMTKKLKAKWTPELGQDLNAYHNLDAEVELTSILSEQIALEIDREILADLVNGATAATYYWSRSPGLFLNRATGAEIGAASAAPDFTGTVSEWYETLIETINDVSARIHTKTLRGGANFVIVSPEVANILEFTAGFRANVTADADKGEIGAVKVGSLNRKFDVIVDPYFLRNVILVGRKGSSFLESGYVYAPYVPLQTTPTIFGPEDFVPRKGVMTRYAKKMVRPDMYGLVIIRGLLGEAGATA
tara:strand:- start:628 stop:2499 length:1872 start_codon:yes stop_codon:yes gene_type:complete